MPTPAHVAEELRRGLGRRGFLRAVAAAGALGAGATVAGCGHRHDRSVADAATDAGPGFAGTVLQPDVGDIPGEHYVKSTPDTVLWGFVPSIHERPIARIRSGQTVTMDLVSHEGILEDQGRDPVAYFGSHGVAPSDVLHDAQDIAAHYRRTDRDFTNDGPTSSRDRSS